MISEIDYLKAVKLIADYEREQLNKTVGDTSVDSRGIDVYFEDLEKWENGFYCNECGRDSITDFAYDRTVSNGEVWHCKHCKTETVVENKPKEDNYCR